MTTHSKGNQEIFQKSKKTFLINCQINFPHQCKLNELRKYSFKSTYEQTSKGLKHISLIRLLMKKIYLIFSNVTNIISGHEIREKPQNKSELKGILTIM